MSRSGIVSAILLASRLSVLVFVSQVAAAQPRQPDPAAADAPFDIRTVDPETFRAVAVRLPPGQAPAIDGRLDDEVWKLAPAQGRFIQREPRYGAPSSEATEFRVLYDDKTIYIAVWAWDDDPAGILGNEMKRDSGLRKSDQIKINLDTFHDHRNAYYFSTNPLGAEKDANTVENGRTINYDWNAVWENRTSIDDKGWYVEAAIPLSQLRFPDSPGDAVWGLNVCRIIFRKNEEVYWVPFPREWGPSGFARVSNAGVLTGLNGLRARRRVEFVPFVAPSGARDYLLQGRASGDAKVGGDFKIGLTSDLTADLTFHTDFAQVEADQEVVNLTRFSLFFPEKRQFFTEGAGIFDYGKGASGLGGDAATNDPGLLALFYSRRIGLVDGREVPLVGGARVTGRAGPYTVGALNITTDRAELRQGSATRRIDKANFTVARVKRNVLSNSSVGAIFLNSSGGISDYNRALGLDAGLFLGPRVTLTGIFAKTDSPGVRGKDTAGVADLNYKSDQFTLGAQYQNIGERFDAEMGFIPRLDVRALRAKAGWTPRPKWRGVRQLLLTGVADYYERHDGTVDSRTQSFDAQLQRQDTSSARVTVRRDFDDLTVPFPTAGTAILPGAYQWTTASLSYTSNQTRRLYGVASTEVGGYYDGEKQTVQLNVNILAGRTLLLEPNFTRNRVTLPGRPPYTSNVVNFRVSNSFTPNLFVKAFAQYNDDRRTASFNALLWYIYKPGSDLYVVYNQGWDTQRFPDQYRVRSRSLSVKMTYWLAR